MTNLLLRKRTPNGLQLIVDKLLVPHRYLMQQLNRDLLVIMRKRTKLQVLAAVALECPTAVLALIPLRVIQLLDLIVGEWAIPVPAIVPLPALQMRIVDDAQIPASIALAMVKPATRVLIIARMGDLALSGLEGLEVEPEKLMLLQVGMLLLVHPRTEEVVATVGEALRGLVYEWMEVVLEGVVGGRAVLAGMMVTCWSQEQRKEEG